MSTTATTSLSGHCYCGQVKYQVDVDPGILPLFAAYCHCDSCRRAHSAPLYQVVCIDRPSFRVTAGGHLLTEFRKATSTITRTFCSACGSKVMNTFSGWRPDGREPLAFFPDTLDAAMRGALPEDWKPKRNHRPNECVLDPDVLGALALFHTEAAERASMAPCLGLND